MSRARAFVPITCSCLAVALGGCNLQPSYEAPVPAIADSFPSGSAYQGGLVQPSNNGAQQAGAEQPASEVGWREFFRDQRLQALISLALRNNQDLEIAMLNVEAARAQYRITRSQLLPYVDAAASASRERTPSNLSSDGAELSTEYSVGLNVSWELDFFGRIASLKDEALAQYFSLAQTRKAAEIVLVSQVANQYLAMLGSDDQLAVTRSTLKNAEESYRITKLSFDNGIATELDLHQSQGIVEQVSASLEAYTRARAQDENALVLLIGQPIPEGFPVGLSLSDQALLSDIPAGLPSQLLQRRPDIAAAEQKLIAANASIGAARAAFFPTVSLTGSYGTLSPSTRGLFQGGQGAWSVVPQISVPIFAGGANRANLDAAQVQKRIEVANYQKVIQVAFREVSDGLAARGTYDRQIQYLQQYESTQTRRLELSDLRYRSGVDGHLSVLEAQTDLFDANQSLVAARVSRASNLVSLYKALGGGWTEGTSVSATDASIVN